MTCLSPSLKRYDDLGVRAILEGRNKVAGWLRWRAVWCEGGHYHLVDRVPYDDWCRCGHTCWAHDHDDACVLCICRHFVGEPRPA